MFQGFRFPSFSWPPNTSLFLSLSLSLSLRTMRHNKHSTETSDISMWWRGGFGVCVCVLEWISGWVLGCVSISVWVSAFVFVFQCDFGLGFGFCLRFRFVFRVWVSASLFVSGQLFLICWFQFGLLIFLLFSGFSDLVFCSFLLIFPICLFFQFF